MAPLAVSVSVDVATPELDRVTGLKLQERPETGSFPHERERVAGFTGVPLLVAMVIVSVVWLDWDT